MPVLLTEKIVLVLTKEKPAEPETRGRMVVFAIPRRTDL
jgi:hypothetical protein